MPARIGIPQGLLYHEYGLVWEKFFSYLGFEVVVSGETTKATLDAGSCLDEICLPAKVFFGHCCALRQKADFLFVPRVISVAAGKYMCPKMIAMPDLLRVNAKELPPLLDIPVNLRQGWRNLAQAMPFLGQQLGKNSWQVFAAWIRAWRQQATADCLSMPEARTRVAVVSHPYLIGDKLISMNLLSRLRRCKVEPVASSQVPVRQAAQAAQHLGKDIFWSGGRHLAGAAMVLMTGPQPVDGLIFLTSFACGPDALLGEMIRQQSMIRHVPCMLLSVDEHTSEAGFVTRVEAFADMLTRRGRP